VQPSVLLCWWCEVRLSFVWTSTSTLWTTRAMHYPERMSENFYEAVRLIAGAYAGEPQRFGEASPRAQRCKFVVTVFAKVERMRNSRGLAPLGKPVYESNLTQTIRVIRRSLRTKELNSYFTQADPGDRGFAKNSSSAVAISCSL